MHGLYVREEFGRSGEASVSPQLFSLCVKGNLTRGLLMGWLLHAYNALKVIKQYI
jgi:hypothetical protein